MTTKDLENLIKKLEKELIQAKITIVTLSNKINNSNNSVGF